MLFTLFCGRVWWKTAFNGCLGRFEAGVRVSPERVIKSIQLLPL